MKNRTRNYLNTPNGSYVVILGYVCSLVALAVGLHIYLVGTMDIHVFGSIVGLVIAAVTFLLNLTGWTIFGFVPIGGLVAFRTYQAAAKRELPAHHVKELFTAMEFALALGMAGTIWAFIRVGKNYADSGTGDPHTSFMTILMGFGSTFAALLVIMSTLGVVFWFHFSGNRSQSSELNPS